MYAPVPLTALGQNQVLDDPWVAVPELFGPAYIGGWSAAEHWGLTEQLFRSICVLTTRPIRSKTETIQGIEFSLKHVRPSVMFGTQPLWRGSVKSRLGAGQNHCRRARGPRAWRRHQACERLSG